MKNLLNKSIALIGASVLLARVSALAQCPLPDSALTTGIPSPATFSVVLNRVASYFTATIAPNGSFPGGTFNAWCSDAAANINSFGASYTGTIIDSQFLSCPNAVHGSCVPAVIYQPDSSFTPDPCVWNEINYLINHKVGSANSIQVAIWDLISPPDAAALATTPGSNPADVSTMVIAAMANDSFVPGPGQLRAAVLFVNDNTQIVFLEIPVPSVPVTADCVTINAVEGSPITPVTMVGSGGCGGPYSFSAVGLPAGISMSASGTISGTPTVSGTFNYTVTVKDSCGNTGTVNCSVTVLPPVTSTCVTISAVQGSPITPVTMVGSGGCGGPYTFSATGLPAGVSMASNGTISGTPTVSGTFSYTVTVTDACGNTGTINCSVTVVPTSPCTINGVTISGTSWNSFPIPSGTSPLIWVHMHIGKPTGIPTTGVTTVEFTDVTLTLNGTPYTIPDGVLIFDSSAPSTITTTFAGGKWQTHINPNFMSDEMFFTGAAIPVTASIAAGAKANLTYNTVSSVTGLSFQWQWSAAVYTFWPTDWNLALIQPFHSSFHAGTPLNTTVQKSLIQGPRGGGGSNFTGSWSATGNAACPK